MKLLEGPQVLVSFKSPDDFAGWVSKSLNPPSDLDEQIRRYELRNPILAHHKSCKCYRCVND